MKILYFYPDDGSYMAQWQKFHIVNEMQNHGHNIELFNPLNFNSLEAANCGLLKYLKSNQPYFDLFINSTGSDELFKETVLEIKKIGIRSLLICFDNLHAPFMHKEIAPLFDLVWLTSQETKYMFRKWGCNIVFMPYAANPLVFRPEYDNELPVVGFIGMPYGSRINKLHRLTDSGIKCQVYYSSPQTYADFSHGGSDYLSVLKTGLNLLKFDIGRKVILGAIKNKYISKVSATIVESPNLERKPSVTFERMNYLYSNFAISLGITELRNTYTLKKPVHKLHLRTFEIPMCGGLQLSSYTDELAGYFENGKEIILYKSDEEMVSKAKFYLREDNKHLRDSMKIMARKRAENDHTWFRRFEIVFKALNIK